MDYFETRGRTEHDRIIFLITALSLTCFIAGLGLGIIYIIAYFAIWVAYLSAYPGAGSKIFSEKLPWLFPGLMLLSATWSQFPMISARTAVELIMTTGSIIVVAKAQSPRSFIAALMCALLVLIIAGMFFGQSEIIYQTGETAQHGLFSSKNNFAMFNCLLLLSSVSVMVDRRSRPILKALAMLGIVVSLVLIALARSIGADLAVALALMTFLIVVALQMTPKRKRPVVMLLVMIVAIAAVAMTVALLLQGDFLRSILSSVGKNSSLTGRGYLWQRGAELIAKRPFFGLGYQSFWVQTYVEAEGLWRYLHVESRNGVTFHNLFFETAIEVGYVGVTVLFATIAASFLLCMRWALLKPTPASGFFAALSIFFIARFYVECDFVFPYAHGTLLLPTMYIYALNGGRSAVFEPAASLRSNRSFDAGVSAVQG